LSHTTRSHPASHAPSFKGKLPLLSHLSLDLASVAFPEGAAC
jgi:hypothetical protein